jgi:DNA (cytosine-5)-methyltransferase 1
LSEGLDKLKYSSKRYREPANPFGTVAELFAGVGGFRIGLSRANLKTVYSNQWEPGIKKQYASEIYGRKFGLVGHSNSDIAQVPSIPVPFDILVGGFPCQDYSVAKSSGKASGLSGKKGVLWWEILRLVNVHRPKYVFLENVDRLLKSPSSQRGRDFAVMLKSLGDEGYIIEWRVINAAAYGCSQRRIRVFILATKIGLGKNFEPNLIIAGKGVLARAFPTLKSAAEPHIIDLSAEIEDISDTFNKSKDRSPFLNAGVYFNDYAYTTNVSADYRGSKKTLGDVLVDETLVPENYWISDSTIDKWEALKNAKSIERTHKASGKKYKYSEGKMSFPDSTSAPSRTILTAEGGSSPSRFKHAIRGLSGLRRLVPIELERLNGFPDDWTALDASGASVPDSKRAFLMGNALVIPLVERVGKVLAHDLKG